MRRLALLPRVALGGCLPLALAGCMTAPTPGPSEPAPSATAETPSAPPSAEPTPTDSPSPIPDTHELDITVHETFDQPALDIFSASALWSGQSSMDSAR